MKDINEVSRSTAIRKLVKCPALVQGGETAVAVNGVNKTTAAPDKAVFDEHERELLKDCTQEDLAGLTNLKKAFPGSRVIKVSHNEGVESHEA